MQTSPATMAKPITDSKLNTTEKKVMETARLEKLSRLHNVESTKPCILDIQENNF